MEVTEGHGHDPESALVVGINNSDSVYFKVPNDEIAGIAGDLKMGKSGCSVHHLSLNILILLRENQRSI